MSVSLQKVHKVILDQSEKSDMTIKFNVNFSRTLIWMYAI